MSAVDDFRAGDVRPDGAIVAKGGEAVWSGALWVYRHQAEKARAFGWAIIDGDCDKKLPNDLVKVHRNAPERT